MDDNLLVYPEVNEFPDCDNHFLYLGDDEKGYSYQFFVEDNKTAEICNNELILCDDNQQNVRLKLLDIKQIA